MGDCKGADEVTIIKEYYYSDNIAGNYIYCLDIFTLSPKIKKIILPDEINRWVKREK